MDLNKIRKEHGVTLKEVSNVLGYKYPGGYHKIEQGKQKLTLEQALKLADYYDLNPQIFLNRSYSV